MTAKGTLRLAVLLAIVLFYFALPNARPDFSVYNSHDSESYLALSYAMTHGYGYTRSLDPDRHIPHKMWPPGFPLLLTPATIGAEGPLSWGRVKVVTTALGLFGLVPLWLWVRRLGGPFAADIATFAIAVHPLYWDFSHQAMAEVPLFSWLVFSLWWIDRTWSNTVTPRGALLCGLLCGLGMLLKGHAAALLVAPLAYAIGVSGVPARKRLALWVLYGFAFCIPFGLWSARNLTVEAPGPDGFSQLHQVLTGDPMNPRSEVRGPIESVISVVKKLRRHAIYRIPSLVVPGLWTERAFDWSGSGWLALPLTLLLFGTAVTHSRGTWAAVGVALALTVLNVNYGYGGAVRFWVPVSLLLVALIASRFSPVLAGLPSRWRWVAAGGAALALVVSLVSYVAAHQRHPFNPNGPWTELAGLFDAARGRPFETQGVLTPNPHAFQLTTGLPAPMLTTDSQFDHMVTRTDGVGPQPPRDSVQILAVEPWALWRLPRPVSGRELLRENYSMGW